MRINNKDRKINELHTNKNIYKLVNIDKYIFIWKYARCKNIYFYNKEKIRQIIYSPA